MKLRELRDQYKRQLDAYFSTPEQFQVDQIDAPSNTMRYTMAYGVDSISSETISTETPWPELYFARLPSDGEHGYQQRKANDIANSQIRIGRNVIGHIERKPHKRVSLRKRDYTGRIRIAYCVFVKLLDEYPEVKVVYE